MLRPRVVLMMFLGTSVLTLKNMPPINYYPSDSPLSVSKTEYSKAYSNAKAYLAKCEEQNHRFLINGVDKERTQWHNREYLTPTAIKIRRQGIICLNLSCEIGEQGKKKCHGDLSEKNYLEFIGKDVPQPECPYAVGKCDADSPYRTIDGSCNNLFNKTWGMAHTPFRRLLPNAYDDGLDTPRFRSVFPDKKLPGVRQISNAMIRRKRKTKKNPFISQFLVFFTQFVAHDIERFAQDNGDGEIDCCASIGIENRSACFPIDVSPDDPFYKRFQKTCINFVRSMATPRLDCKLGPREQLNQETSFIDASMIYGSNQRKQRILRAYQNGLLDFLTFRRSILLPPDLTNETECMNDFPRRPPCFAAGDVRVNENAALTVQHTIWMRQHNRIAGILHRINRHWDDERLFQESKRINTAVLQHIIYNELLPVVVGWEAMERYRLWPEMGGDYFYGYSSVVNPTTTNVFSVAAFRFGHSMLDNDFLAMGFCSSRRVKTRPRFLLRRYFRQMRKKYKVYRRTCNRRRPFYPNSFRVELRRFFNRPELLFKSKTGINSIIFGMLLTKAGIVDNEVPEDVTNHLFEDEDRPGTGDDLISLNLQRGRDHGIRPYNDWREECGLPRAKHWKTQKGGLVDHSAKVARLLKAAYGTTPDDMDLFIGGLTEIPIRDGLLGPTFTCIVARQFSRYKFGDRFWYENPGSTAFTKRQLRQIRKASLASVVLENSGLKSILRYPLETEDAYCNPFVERKELPKMYLRRWRERRPRNPKSTQV